MELQAIRYAAMVSAMTFERAVGIHAQFLASIGNSPAEAQTSILGFLGWDEPDEEAFGLDVRILLVSEGFGRELTTAVLWLRERDIDIRCMRLRPYHDGQQKLIDVQQIIPLPEANDYQIQLREKEQVGRKKRAERYDILLKFWSGLISIAQKKGTRHGQITPGSYGWIGAGSGVRGLGFNYTVTKEIGVVELYIDRGDAVENATIFDQFIAHKSTIEQALGSQLAWERLDNKRACRIKFELADGGYRSPESAWPGIQHKMVDAMTRFENAILPVLEKIKI